MPGVLGQFSKLRLRPNENLASILTYGNRCVIFLKRIFKVNEESRFVLITCTVTENNHP